MVVVVVVWSGRRDGEGVATSTSVDAIERFRVDFLLAPASSGRRPVCFHFPPGLSLSLSLSLFSAFLFSFLFFWIGRLRLRCNAVGRRGFGRRGFELDGIPFCQGGQTIAKG